MRPTLRLLAAVKPTHLTPNTPTGLTGLRNHPYPRYALVDLYSRTLAALQTLPDTSVYRQSCEALTKHRLSIVESVKPLGYDEWATATKKRVEQSVQTDLQNFKQQLNVLDDFEQEQAKAGISATEADDLRERNRQILRNKLQFIEKKPEEAVERKFEVLKSREVRTSITPPPGEKPPPEKREEWMDGGFDTEASMQRKLRASMQAVLSTDEGDDDEEVPEWWQPSPTLDIEQISKIENEIGSGLIEEVIQVAEGELKLVNEVADSQAWEPLVEKPPEGQWHYFERGTHTGATQSPERTHT